MRPLLEAWLAAQGVPGWLAPSYATMVGLAALAASAVVLSRAEREGDDAPGTAGTLLVAYAGALLGGYLYELLRVTPAALAAASLHPYLHVGRAAYGGLVFGTLAALLDLWRRRADAGAFFDRVALVLGLVYAAVRVGCFLEGCDFGTPTASGVGVAYPPGSLAALAHAEAGWVPEGAASLPTHPTQLYEGAVALAASLVALGVRARARQAPGAPSGAAFLAWLVVYAAGRAAVEALRGDAERGIYAGASSAQWTSLGVGVIALTLLGALAARVRREGEALAMGGADAR